MGIISDLFARMCALHHVALVEIDAQSGGKERAAGLYCGFGDHWPQWVEVVSVATGRRVWRGNIVREDEP